MKILTTFALVCLSIVNAAAEAPKLQPSAPVIPEGSYEGRVQDADRGKASLLLRPYPGRTGSYITIIIIGDRSTAYIVDPLDPNALNTYGMTPLQVTPDGEIGIVNDDPSLVLTVGVERTRNGLPGFTISNANSANQIGFQGSIVFEAGDTSALNWLDFNPGRYGATHGNDYAIISPMDDNRQASALFNGGDHELSGNFSIREKVLGIFTLKAISVKATGVETQAIPKRVGVFIMKTSCFIACWHSQLFVLIDPAKDNAFRIFKK